MRKLHIFTLILLFPVISVSQTNPITLIKNAGSVTSDIICDFMQQRHTVMFNKVETLEGKLYFSATDRMSMHYTNPPTNLLVINSDQFYMDLGKRKNLFNLTQNATIRSLAHLLLNSMHGDVEAIATETDAQIEYTSDAQYHIFTLTKTKREIKGYRRVVLKYAKTDLLLHYMLLEEHFGNYNTYTLTNHTLQTPPPDKYLIPKKQ